MNWQELLEKLNSTYMGNELWRFLALLGCVLAGLVAGRIAAFAMDLIAGRMEKADRRLVLRLMLKCLSRPAAFFIFAYSLQIGLSLLVMDQAMRTATEPVLRTLFAVALGYAIYRLVDVVDYYLHKWALSTESRLDDMLVPLVRKSIRITIGIVVAIFIIQNFYGTERMATLLAGLGVGGLAIALAAQDTIKNFFGSFMILVDKPFQVGDRIVFGGCDGPVEQVGFRSTKIRTLDGHLVTVPNSKIADDVVENVGKRPHIRRVANITVTYDTPPEKMKRAVDILHEILDNHEGMAPELPPRIYFSEFNDASLNIIVYYWFSPADWWQYLEFSHKVNMQILDRFNAEGIEFAFPTQTLYLAHDPKRRLKVEMSGELPERPAT